MTARRRGRLPAGALPVPRRPRRLGPGARRPRERDRSGDDARLRRAVADVPARDPPASGRDVGPSRRADGQLRGRSHEPRRRRDREAGPGADRRRDRRRELLREPGAARGVRRRPRTGPAGACTCSGSSPTAGSTPAGRTSRPASSSPRARASPTSSCTRSPTGATRCPPRAPATSRELERWLRHAGRIGTVGGRYYGDGPRPALGADEARLRRDRPRRGPTRRDARPRRSRRRTTAARPTSSSSRP